MTAISRMTDAQFGAFLEAKNDAMAAFVGEALLDMQTPPEVEIGEKYYRDDDLVCLAVVIHRRRETGVWISTDGDQAKAVRIPTKVGSRGIPINPLPNAPEFATVLLRGWLANGRTGDYARPPLVQARNPQLCDHVQWTERQRAAWGRVTSQRLRILAEAPLRDHAGRLRPRKRRGCKSYPW